MSLSPIGPRPNPPSVQPSRSPKSGTREAVHNLVGFAGQVVGGLTAAVPGAVVGGLYAAEWKLPKESRHSKELGALMHAGMSVASSVAQQASTAFLLQLPGTGLSTTNWATAAAGSAWQYYSGGSCDVAERIYQAIDQEATRPTDSPTMIANGIFHGLVEGTRGGAHEGGMQGVGIVEGTIEGARDGWQGLLGKWDVTETPPDTRAKSLPRKIVEASVGVMGGALYALDGAVQGAVRGVLGRRGQQQSSYNLQAALAGAVGGGVLLGPMGAIGGLIIGNWAGHRIHCSESESLARALDESLANSPDLGNKQANTYRDTVEGALVGCLVGARNGMKAGSRRAQELVDHLCKGRSDVP